ncbi:hypothetical protein [Tepidimonas sp.]|uniref:type IV pilus modification PilV family protein n=1 Tax=Tepidimonas sp. TaxID=2002775 RepID=UPI00391D6553
MAHSPKRRSPRYAHAGYILVEGLVAMMVVAAGILGIAKLQSAIVTASADAKATSMAYSLGRAKLEELRNTTLKTEHQGTSCAAGTIVRTGSDTVSLTGLETTYTRAWTVTPATNVDGSCTAARHRIQVTVTWTTRERSKNVTLHSTVSWNDPLATSATLGTGGTGGGAGGAPPTTAKFVPDDYAFTEDSTVRPTGNDKARIVRSTKGEYILLVDNKAKIASSVPFVRLSGLVAVDQTAGKNQNPTSILNVTVYRSDVTYCIFPLPFSDENDPETYGLRPDSSTPGASLTTDTAAAYVCYVPEGWRGNIGLLQKSYNCNDVYNLFDGTTRIGKCDFRADLACPGETDGSAFLSGIRNIKTLVRNTSGAVVGASGVLPSHEVIAMPTYSNLKQTWRLDFAIIRDSTTCANVFKTTGSAITGTAPATYTVFRRAGEWLGLDANGIPKSGGREGVPSLVYTQHVLANEASLLHTISGSGTNCTGARAVSAGYPYADGVCSVDAGNYSCQVPHGWSGTITLQPNGDPASRTFTTVTGNINGESFTCSSD